MGTSWLSIAESVTISGALCISWDLEKEEERKLITEWKVGGLGQQVKVNAYT